MKHLARILCLVSVLALMVVCMTACPDNGGNTSSKPSESNNGGDDSTFDYGGMTITLATPHIVEQKQGVNRKTDLLLKRIAEAEKKYNIKFEINDGIDQSDYWDNMVAIAMSGGAFGDIMLIYPYFLDEWVAGNIVTDIAPIAEKVGVNWEDGSWDPLVKETGTFGSKIYSFCREQTTLTAGLLYNPRLLKAAGLEDPSVWVEKDEWNFDKLEEYARKLTVRDSSGNVTQYGLSTTTCELFMGAFMLANNGSAVTYGEDNMPSITMDSANSLEALNVFQKMVNTDKSVECQECFTNWQVVADRFCDGKVGMMVAEEWVIEYVRDVLMENGNGEDYALTYFPKGPHGTDYVDASLGGMTEYFIYNSGDAERQEAAFRVYCDLFAPDEELTQEEIVETTAENLLPDENSVKVYTDIILNGKAKSLNLYKLGLNVRGGFKDIFNAIVYNEGTPQSIINSWKDELEAYAAECTYVIEIKKQNGFL